MTTQTLLDFDLGESSSDSDFRIEDHDDDSDDFSASNDDPSGASDYSDDDEDDDDDDDDNDSNKNNRLVNGNGDIIQNDPFAVNNEKGETINLTSTSIQASSKTKRIFEKDSKTLLNVSICSVCLGDRSDDTNEIVECDNCGISVHEGL